MEEITDERPPIFLNVNSQTMNDIGKYYYYNSLKYYLPFYCSLLIPPMSIIERHVAYLCPICLNNGFIITKKVRITSKFTDDHYPPESVGGKQTILVCETCNNESGHKFDFALKEHLMHLSFDRRIPNSILPSQTIIKDVGKFKGSLRIDDAGEMRLHMKKNENDNILPLDNWTEWSKTNNDWTVEVKINRPHDEKITKALLHAAYLTCFENFGYEFVFSKAGELFRNAMNDKEAYPVNANDLNLDTQEALETIPLGMAFISEPKELQSMIVNLKLTHPDTGYSTIKTILIPNPYPTGIEDIKRIGDKLLGYEGQISMKKLYNFLQMEQFPAYIRMWNTLMKGFNK